MTPAAKARRLARIKAWSPKGRRATKMRRRDQPEIEAYAAEYGAPVVDEFDTPAKADEDPAPLDAVFTGGEL